MKTGWLALFVVPVALALGASDEDRPQHGARERLAKAIRIRQVIGLAEALNLNEADAVRVADVIRTFQQRRQPLQDQVAEASRILRRAAEGDASAASQVDYALEQTYVARDQIAILNREMFTVLSQKLSPQQRAKMSLFFAKFQSQLRTALAKRARQIATARNAAQEVPPSIDEEELQ
jgi:hypothetical protein